MKLSSRPLFLKVLLRKHRFHDTLNHSRYRFLISSTVSRGQTIFNSVLTESRSKNTWLVAKDDYTINWFSNKHLLGCVHCPCSDIEISPTQFRRPYVEYIFIRDVQWRIQNFFVLSCHFRNTGGVCACIAAGNVVVRLCVGVRRVFMQQTEIHVSHVIFFPEYFIRNFLMKCEKMFGRLGEILRRNWFLKIMEILSQVVEIILHHLIVFLYKKNVIDLLIEQLNLMMKYFY